MSLPLTVCIAFSCSEKESGLSGRPQSPAGDQISYQCTLDCKERHETWEEQKRYWLEVKGKRILPLPYLIWDNWLSAKSRGRQFKYKRKNTYKGKKAEKKRTYLNIITSYVPVTKHVRYYRVWLTKWWQTPTSNSHSYSFDVSASRRYFVTVKVTSLFTANDSYWKVLFHIINALGT